MALGPSAWSALRAQVNRFSMQIVPIAKHKRRSKPLLIPMPRRGNAVARADRRLYRLLCVDLSRDESGKTFSPRQSAAAELQICPDRLPRPRFFNRRERSRHSQAQRTNQAASCRRTSLWAVPLSGLRTRSRHVHRSRQHSWRSPFRLIRQSSISSASASSMTGLRAIFNRGNISPSARFWRRTSRPPFLPGSFRWRLWRRTGYPLADRPDGDPAPLPYLAAKDTRYAGIDLNLEVFLQSQQMRQAGIAPMLLSKGNLRDLYWSVAQLVTHHASSGCNLRPGDLLATGTISGPEAGFRGLPAGDEAQSRASSAADRRDSRVPRRRGRCHVSRVLRKARPAPDRLWPVHGTNHLS